MTEPNDVRRTLHFLIHLQELYTITDRAKPVFSKLGRHNYGVVEYMRFFEILL